MGRFGETVGDGGVPEATRWRANPLQRYVAALKSVSRRASLDGRGIGAAGTPRRGFRKPSGSECRRYRASPQTDGNAHRRRLPRPWASSARSGEVRRCGGRVALIGLVGRRSRSRCRCACRRSRRWPSAHPVAILPADAPAHGRERRRWPSAFQQSGAGQRRRGGARATTRAWAAGDETDLPGTRGNASASRTRDDVATLQDFLATRPLREAMSKPGSVRRGCLPVGPRGRDWALAARQGGARADVADIVEQSAEGSAPCTASSSPAPRPPSPTSTRPGSATGFVIEARDHRPVVLSILLIIYRNLVTMLLPLITIGISRGNCAGRRGWLCRTGARHCQPDHHLHERDDGRRGNRLRRLPDQPLSRLSCGTARIQIKR